MAVALSRTEDRTSEYKIPLKAAPGQRNISRYEISSEHENFYKIEYIDPIHKPLAEFHFKYRSRDILQQMMIIPRDPPLIATEPLPSQPKGTNRIPTVPALPSLGENPFMKPIAKMLEGLTAQNHKTAEMAALPASESHSVITGRSFYQMPGAFSPGPSQMAPKIADDYSTPAQTMRDGYFRDRPASTPNAITYPTTPTLGFIPPQIAPGSSPKAGPAMPIETPAKALSRSDVKSLASAESRVALEPLATPITSAVRIARESAITRFTWATMEVKKSLSHSRYMAKGQSVVNVVEDQDQDQLLKSEDGLRAEVETQVKPELSNPEEKLKRERADEQDDDLEIVLERPVKRRHIFTAEDIIIDLTAD